MAKYYSLVPDAKPAKPAPAKPAPAKPALAKPAPAKPEPAKPEPAKPEPAKPELAKPEPAEGSTSPLPPAPPGAASIVGASGLTAEVAAPRQIAESVVMIPHDQLVSGQIRHRTDLARLTPLAISIARDGLLELPIVRSASKIGGKYEILSGHHRIEAIRLILQTPENYAPEVVETYRKGIPCRVQNVGGADAETRKILANSLRADMTFLELADAFSKIKTRYGYNSKAIAYATGYSEAHVSNCLRVAEKVVPTILNEARSGKADISAGKLIKLAGLNPVEQKNVYEDMGYGGNTLTTELPKPVIKPPSKAKIEEALAGLIRAQESELDAGAILALRWVTGDLKSWPRKLSDPTEADEQA